MPRYNLNHDDVAIISKALDQLAFNASSTKEHEKIKNLKDRLLFKVDYPEDYIDVWSAFQSQTPVQKPESL